VFVPKHPSARYHAPSCRITVWKARKRARELAREANATRAGQRAVP
jgi:hypothetical protein